MKIKLYSQPSHNIRIGELGPLFNDNQCWEGSVLPLQEIEALAYLVKRKNELLRFPISRNLVD
jgi:hypothetical protein